MNIPLDNLYHWVRGLANEPVSIYTFSPHGSKNITDLNFFSVQDDCKIAPEIVCHDQEPLDHSSVSNISLHATWTLLNKKFPGGLMAEKTAKILDKKYQKLNFYTMLRLLKERSIFDRYVLLHSEKNSTDVEKFSESAEPVYYWCHAVIARDWYRFAQFDPRLNKKSKSEKTFLVYCRAWTGTREYRLKFLDLLIEQGLINDCKTSILHCDQEQDIISYQCKNSNLQPTNLNQLLAVNDNVYPASASADYSADDITSTDISIVLETVADTTKIHLTEKTLRPIACGHPFMLVAGPGALEYLKDYGFKTFAPYINESYDQITDTVERLNLITKEMLRIQQLPAKEKNQLFYELQKIADYNKKHFFSQQFIDYIQQELACNLNCAIAKIKHTRGRHCLELSKLNKKYQCKTASNKLNVEILKTLRRLRRDPSTSITALVDQFPPNFFMAP